MKGGAKFFGWADGSIASMTLACDGCDFAFAQMVEGAEVVPEPMTLVLLVSGLSPARPFLWLVPDSDTA